MTAERFVWVPFEVDKKFDGLRIDQFLSQRLIGYSRNKVQKILEEARVLKAGRVAKANVRVRTGDKIDIAYLRRQEIAPALEVTEMTFFCLECSTFGMKACATRIAPRVFTSKSRRAGSQRPRSAGRSPSRSPR